MASAVQQAERRLIRRIVLLTAPLGVAAMLLMPNAGPVLRNFSLPSTSMHPSLPIGSFIVVSRLSYGYSRYSFDDVELPVAGRWPELVPARGDVIVFRLPRDRSTPYIKRVIGLPGETVELVKGRLLIDGKIVERGETAKRMNPLSEGPRQLVPTYIERLPGGASHEIIETDGDSGHFDNAGPFKVPAGHIFVLGDNRDNSQDSRALSAVGMVPIDHVIGRAVFIWKASPPTP